MKHSLRIRTDLVNRQRLVGEIMVDSAIRRLTFGIGKGVESTMAPRLNGDFVKDTRLRGELSNLVLDTLLLVETAVRSHVPFFAAGRWTCAEVIDGKLTYLRIDGVEHIKGGREQRGT